MKHPSQHLDHRRAHGQLSEFFTQQAERRSESTQHRYARVHRHLLEFLAEADLSGLLTAHESSLLIAGRSSGRAFLDVLTFDELVICLPRFVEPRWLLPASVDARAQIALAGRLITWLDSARLLAIDTCSFLESSARVKAAQQQRRTAGRAAARSGQAQLTLLPGGLADL